LEFSDPAKSASSRKAFAPARRTQGEVSQFVEARSAITCKRPQYRTSAWAAASYIGSIGRGYAAGRLLKEETAMPRTMISVLAVSLALAGSALTLTHKASARDLRNSYVGECSSRHDVCRTNGSGDRHDVWGHWGGYYGPMVGGPL
jgi:hypothetical protein